MLVRNVGALLGKDLRYVPRTSIRIREGRFVQIGARLRPEQGEETVDCEGLLAMPGLVNCHTHLGDSIAKDVFLGGSVDGKIHPVFGIKPRILKNTKSDHLASFMRNSCISMLRKGITTFADFREGDLGGVQLLRKALLRLPIRAVILGRIESYHSADEIRHNAVPGDMGPKLDQLLGSCDGLGISGANENSTPTLRYYSGTTKLRAIHAAETEQSVLASRQTTGRSEVSRALALKPHFLVHMTYASRRELGVVARRSVGIVVCPRANASLAEGIPNVELMQKSGCTVALGTDNIMINSPDMFREMDYLWKITMGMGKKRMAPREILKMATVNGGTVLHRDVGIIEKNKLADCIFLDKHSLDLEPMHNPHAAIVHRADQTSIRAVMVGGRKVHGKL